MSSLEGRGGDGGVASGETVGEMGGMKVRAEGLSAPRSEGSSTPEARAV